MRLPRKIGDQPRVTLKKTDGCAETWKLGMVTIQRGVDGHCDHSQHHPFFLLTSIVWLQSPRPARWIGWLGLVTAASGFLGMFRNVIVSLGPIAALNNYLLPVFMIVLGIALARWREVSPQPAGE